MSIKKKAFLGLLLVSVLWGSAGTVAKILIKELHPFVVLFYRFSLASVILLPWYVTASKSKNTWRILLPLSALSVGNALFYYIGLMRTSVSSAAVIGACTPLMTAIFSHFLISERTSKEKIIGIIIGLLGALIIIVLPLWHEGRAIGGDVVGNIFIMVSIFSWTLYMVKSRKLLMNKQFSPVVMAEYNFFTLAIVSLILSIISGQTFFTQSFNDPNYILVFLYTTILVTVVTFWVFQWVLQHISATTSALKDYIQLIVGVLLSIILLGERMNQSFIIGTLIVLLGLSIATGKTIISRILRG